MLEWRANRKRVQMALGAETYDGRQHHAAVESMTTAEEFAANILNSRDLPKDAIQGWTVTLEDGDTAAELVGGKVDVLYVYLAFDIKL